MQIVRQKVIHSCKFDFLEHLMGKQANAFQLHYIFEILTKIK